MSLVQSADSVTRLTSAPSYPANRLPYSAERAELACAFRWTARLNMHEAVANHFSLCVGNSATQFLINPNQMHFSRIQASSLLLLDAENSATLSQPNAPDPTAWGLHASIHKALPHATCAMHVHSIHATILAALKHPALPPIDQNTATFFNRIAVDNNFGGLAFEEEGKRCAQLLHNPKLKVLVMGNHGILVIGNSVADTFNRLYYFERAAETYIKALWTGQELNTLSDDIAEKTALELEAYPNQAEAHFSELQAILDAEEPAYKH